MAPRWSILLPTHDRAEVVGFAIRSVLAQTTDDWELLVVGDGCTDDTGAVVTSFGGDRVRWFDLPKAPGFGYANRNAALRESRGELIAFIAHDDLLLPDHLERMGALFERPRVEWAYSRPLWIENDGTMVPFAIDLTRPDGFDHFMNVGNHIPASCIAHRRECLDRYAWWPEEVPKGGDYWLWKRMVGPAGGTNLAYLRQPTCLHFRADWRTGPSFGPPPLSSWLAEAHSGWWPAALRIDTSGAALPQEVVWREMEADPGAWTRRVRGAVPPVLEGFAWSAAAAAPILERRFIKSARVLMEGERFESAIELIDEGLALVPASVGLRATKSHALRRSGDAAAAEAMAREAMALQPKHGQAHLALTRALLEQDRLDEALQSARAAVETSPDSVALLAMLGSMLLRTGDLDGAEEQARTGLRLVPDSPGPSNLLKQVEAARERAGAAEPGVAPTPGQA